MKKIGLILFFLAPSLVFADAYKQQALSLLKKFQNEPSVREIHQAALQYALVNQSRISSLVSRARFAGWLPQFRIQYQRDLDDDRNTNFPTPTSPILTTQSTDLDQSYQFRLTWDLEKLIFHPNEISVYKELKRMVELRSDVLKEITKLYFERRRMQVNLLLNPPKNLLSRVRKMIRLQELSADLDALTGGFFSKRMKRK